MCGVPQRLGDGVFLAAVGLVQYARCAAHKARLRLGFLVSRRGRRFAHEAPHGPQRWDAGPARVDVDHHAARQLFDVTPVGARRDDGRPRAARRGPQRVLCQVEASAGKGGRSCRPEAGW